MTVHESCRWRHRRKENIVFSRINETKAVQCQRNVTESYIAATKEKANEMEAIMCVYEAKYIFVFFSDLT